MQRALLLSMVLAFVAAASAFAPTALPALRSPAHRARSMNLKMQADGQDRADRAKRVGASIDADGKSNVWAVEPKMQVEDPNSGGGIQKAAIGILNNAEQL